MASWTPTGTGTAPAPGSAAAGKAGVNTPDHPPAPVLAAAWLHDLSPAVSSATLSVGMGLPKIQTAEITRSSTPATSKMNLTESNEATSHQLKTLKYDLSNPYLTSKMQNICT